MNVTRDTEYKQIKLRTCITMHDNAKRANTAHTWKS